MGSSYRQRVDLPYHEHPEINFVGYVIGVHGDNVKQLQNEVITVAEGRQSGRIVQNTVKLVYKDHPRDQQYWSLYAGVIT